MSAGGANYRDESRIEHMYRAAVRIREKLGGLTRAAMAEGQDATEVILYNVQLIGEAANNIGSAFCEKHPEIDFAGWAGLRHKLVHDYANIDLDIVWNALMMDFPKLEMALKRIVDSLPPSPPLPENIDEFE